MNPLAKRQTALKLALFAVLAGNISFQPITKTMHSLELLSVKPADPAATAPTGTATRSEARSGAPVLPTVPPKPEVPAPPANLTTSTTTTTAAAKTTTTAATVPAIPVSDRYRFKLCSGKAGEREQFIRFHQDGNSTYAELESQCTTCATQIQKIDGPNTDETRQRLAEAFLPALEQAAGCRTLDGNLVDAGPNSDETANKLARCEVKKVRKATGFEFEEIDRNTKEFFQCQIDRLAKVDKELARELGKKPTTQQIQSRVSDISNSVRSPLLKLAKSKDSDDREDARDMLQTLRDRLSDSISRFDLDSEKLDKRVDNLDSAIEMSEKTDDLMNAKAERDDQVKELKERIRDARRDRSRDLEAESMLARLNDRQYNAMMYDPIFNEAQQYRSQLPSEDFRILWDPFADFKQSLFGNSSQDPITGRYRTDSNFEIPSNVWQYRNMAGTNMSPRAGNLSSLPTTAPNLSFLKQAGVSATFGPQTSNGGIDRYRTNY